MSRFIIRPDANIITMLRDKGFSSYVIRKEKVLGESTMQKFRESKLPSWQELDRLIKLLHVSPVALIAWESDNGSVYDLNGKLIKSQPTNTQIRVSPYACPYEDPEYEDNIDPEYE